MSSRRYRTYKFLYDTDLQQSVIKRQRAYLDDAEQEITPITPLFLARVVNFNVASLLKADGGWQKAEGLALLLPSYLWFKSPSSLRRMKLRRGLNPLLNK